MTPLWPQISVFLERACARSRGRYTVRWLAEQIVNRDMQVWAAFDANGERLTGIAVTHMNLYPSGLKVLQVVAAAGRGVTTGQAVAEVIGMLRAYARAQGCAEIEWSGRKGFSRLARFAGAQDIAVICGLGV